MDHTPDDQVDQNKIDPIVTARNSSEKFCRLSLQKKTVLHSAAHLVTGHRHTVHMEFGMRIKMTTVYTKIAMITTAFANGENTTGLVAN